MKEWKYYNHAVIPIIAPHEEVQEGPWNNNLFWKEYPNALFARWTSDFDCGYETNWWYVIKDTPFDISSLKAKRRYEINKGKRYFEVKIIDPHGYADALYEVQIAAFSAYPPKYRPAIDKERFYQGINRWDRYLVFGAFYRETSELAGYALLSEESSGVINFYVLKTKPEHEKHAVNAALIEEILQHFEPALSLNGFICDGTRSINHETAFQDYLEKYFGFRKAYCKLHIMYCPKISGIVKALYPLRRIFLRFDNIAIIHSINSVMKMEEIVRTEEMRNETVIQI